MPSTPLLLRAPAVILATGALVLTSLAAAAPAHGTASACPTATVSVSTAAQLQAALTGAKPGDVIVLSDGVYNGKFVASTPATAAKPITVCGTRQAILNAEGPSGGYVLHLNNADYWTVQGITARHGQKGIILDETDYAVLSDVEVYDTGDEAIHLRNFSSHNLVTGVVVHDTGRRNTKFGEGIYVGSAQSNWGSVSGGVPDASDFNVIQNSTVYATTAESVDIKEGTQQGVLRGNHFDGAALVLPDADSWVDVKGKDWVIESNVGVNSPQDGFQTHEIVSGWGTGNVFRGNTADVNGKGFGFSLTPVRANVVECSNVVTDGAEGYANVTCSGIKPSPSPSPTPSPSPSPTPSPSPSPAAPASCTTPTVTVRTAAELKAALMAAKAGDVIVVAPGTYKGEFEAKAKGTSSAPIVLCGEGAVLVGTGITGGEVLSFNKAAWWRVEGFELRDGQTGLEVRSSTDVVVTSLSVSHVGDEGVVVRSGSERTTLDHLAITDTGVRRAKSGFGVVVNASNDTTITGTVFTKVPADTVKIESGSLRTRVS